MAQSPSAEGVLRGPHKLEYTYRRSLGPVLGRFFNDLMKGKLVGIRSKTGGVIVPPQEYDPQTGETLDEFVDVGPAGEIVSWTWVSKPRAKQPFDHPFAYALIRLDGADTPMLHAIDAGSEDELAKGTRVVARFAAQPTGSICDLTHFELEG
jgi:uncharacterized OB-fold protein